MTIGACSPPCSSSLTASALVDSASDGRNDVDSLFSASEYFPGRSAAMIATTASSQTPATTNLEILPVASVRSRDNPRNYSSSARRSSGSVTGR